jgi:Fic family protein
MGRILNILLFIGYGFPGSPILYLSRYILRNRLKYYQLLREITFNNRREEWILFMLDAIKRTATWTAKKIHSIHDLIGKVEGKVKEKFPKIYSGELMEVIHRSAG